MTARKAKLIESVLLVTITTIVGLSQPKEPEPEQSLRAKRPREGERSWFTPTGLPTSFRETHRRTAGESERFLDERERESETRKKTKRVPPSFPSQVFSCSSLRGSRKKTPRRRNCPRFRRKPHRSSAQLAHFFFSIGLLLSASIGAC